MTLAQNILTHKQLSTTTTTIITRESIFKHNYIQTQTNKQTKTKKNLFRKRKFQKKIFSNFRLFFFVFIYFESNLNKSQQMQQQ